MYKSLCLHIEKEKSTAQPKGGTAMLVCLLQGDFKLLYHTSSVFLSTCDSHTLPTLQTKLAGNVRSEFPKHGVC